MTVFETGRVVSLTDAEVPEVVAVLAAAFHEYPVMRYVLADDAEHYPARLHRLVELFVMGRALRNDPMIGIYTGARLGAAATMSYPRQTTTPPAFAALRDEVWAELGSAARERYDRCVAAWEPLSPDVPQLHINMIGVDPGSRGAGLARRLLEYAHELSRTSPASTGVSLTTETPANVAFYEHFGYQLVGHARIAPALEAWGFFRPDGSKP